MNPKYLFLLAGLLLGWFVLPMVVGKLRGA